MKHALDAQFPCDFNIRTRRAIVDKAIKAFGIAHDRERRQVSRVGHFVRSGTVYD